MSAASAQAASRLAERLAMRSRSARQAEAQTADLVQVHLATIHVFLYRMSLTLCMHSRTCGIRAYHQFTLGCSFCVELPAELCNASRIKKCSAPSWRL